MTEAESFIHRLVGAFHPPDWPWLAAGRILDSRARTPAMHDDDLTALVDYRRALSRCRDDAGLTQVEQRWPHLRKAHLLADSNSVLRAEVQARLLARQRDSEIAKLCGLEPETVAAFEGVFFAVRERLDWCGWILARAVQAPASGVYDRHDLSPLWRFFGYTAGPLVLDVVLAATHPDQHKRRTLDPLLEVLVRLSIAAMTARTSGELLQVLRLGRRVRKAVSRNDGLEACDLALSFLASVDRVEQTAMLPPSEPSSSRSRSPIQSEADDELRTLKAAVQKLEQRAAEAAQDDPTSTTVSTGS